MTFEEIDTLVRSKRDLEEGWSLRAVDDHGLMIFATYRKQLKSLFNVPDDIEASKNILEFPINGLASELKFRITHDSVDQISWNWAVKVGSDAI